MNWVNVGYFNLHADKLDSFQLILISRSDIATGAFQIEFNYNQINWETGDASGGFGGTGGTSAFVGYGSGPSPTAFAYQKNGSGVPGSFLDTNASQGLIHNDLFSGGILGRYDFLVQAPISVTNPGNQTNAEGNTVSLQVSANTTSPPISYAASGLPAGVTMNSASGVINGALAYTDAETQGGNYNVTVSAFDGGGHSGSTGFTWTVTDTTLPPIVTNPGNQTNWQGDGVSLQVQASDPDGDPLTYSATSLPYGLSINQSSGLISGEIASNAASGGPYSTTITASDGPVSTSTSFTWQIPHLRIADLGSQSNLEGDVVSVPVSAWDPYGQTITYSASGLPAGLSINSSTGVISGTVGSTASGSSPYSAVITASDGSGSVSDSLAWTVTHLAVSDPGDQTNAEGDAVSLQMVAEDNTSETLTYSASGLPNGLSIDNGSGLISGTVANLDSNSGPYSVTVSASNGVASASDTFNWTVTHILVTDPSPQISAAGATASLQVQATDPDNDSLTYSATGLPSGLSIGSSGLISGTIATTAGIGSPYNVTVSAADATHVPRPNLYLDGDQRRDRRHQPRHSEQRRGRYRRATNLCNRRRRG